MSGMELNKIMAAVLVAGITAAMSGFIAKEASHPRHLHENAVKIEGAGEASSGGAAAPAGPEPVLALIASADIARGEKVSKACAACHNFEKGGPNGTGPNLWGVVGRPAGSAPGFSYSDAMKGKGGEWSYEELNHFLWKPKAYVEGTKMNFIGVKKADDRAALIAWLRSLSDSPRSLPGEAEIAAEQAALSPQPAALPDAAQAAPAAAPLPETAEDAVEEAPADTHAPAGAE